MENAFGDAQRPAGEGVARTELHHTPPAQDAGGREGAPVGAGEGVEGEAEGRIGALLVIVGGGAEHGEAGVGLQADAEEQDVAFEG